MDLQIGDLVFVKGKDDVSGLIELVTKSLYSHVAIYVGNNQVIEAQAFRKVGYKDIQSYINISDIYRVKMDADQCNKGLKWLINQIGRQYDYWDIFVLFVRCLFQFKIPWHEGHRILCSRLVRDFIFECGINIPDKNMTPEDLVEWVILNGGLLVK